MKFQENGLVIVEDEGSGDDDGEIGAANGSSYRKRVLVSTEAAELLQNAGEGSLGNILIINLISKFFYINFHISMPQFFTDRCSVEEICFREKGVAG